ncbi:CaiB/BaiF CoA transferase family protein [Pseudovibrio flavus]|uniref:CaiB/BaiF CoA transferase family protein n=1 Tax=Pseudovibrio flavus TaxID=2529854 RepID=UPI00211C1DB7|nr:CaiB/BaiF CoA-transferase family protein [Pseudovibrio flavus]
MYSASTRAPNDLPMLDRSLPLDGVIVLDLTLALAGPLSTQRLGEMGAQVVKIEAPEGGDFSRYVPIGELNSFGDSTAFVMMNRQKKSVSINFKDPEGLKTFYRLVAKADVIVQNFRPGVAERLGVDFDTLKHLNSELVYVSISGYGTEGPMKGRPGQDLLLQSFCGLTMNGGSKGGNPQPSPVFMVDVTASHLATEAVLAGLLKAKKSGQPQFAQVSMLGGMMEMQLQEISTYLAHETPPERTEFDSSSIWMGPPYGIHRTADGFLAMAQCDLEELAVYLESAELLKLAKNPKPVSDIESHRLWRDAIYSELERVFATRSAIEWDAYLSPKNVWCMVVQDYKTFLAHPQTQQYLCTMSHPVHGTYTTPKPAIQFNGLEEPQLTPAPLYAADTREVLQDFGFSSQEVTNLEENGAVYQHIYS